MDASQLGLCVHDKLQPLLCKSKIQPIICINQIHIRCCVKTYPLQTADQLQPILAAFRKTAGLTQADLAVRLGVTQQTYSAAERNAANMSVAKLMAVLNALDVELVLQPKSTKAALAPSNQPTAQW